MMQWAATETEGFQEWTSGDKQKNTDEICEPHHNNNEIPYAALQYAAWGLNSNVMPAGPHSRDVALLGPHSPHIELPGPHLPHIELPGPHSPDVRLATGLGSAPSNSSQKANALHILKNIC